jgi:O-antigen/teichoic acid export membrane protein
MNQAAIRFFPRYKEEPDRNAALGRWISVLCTGGFAVFCVLYLGLAPQIQSLYQAKSPLFVQYYLALVPLALGVMSLALFDSLSAAMLDTVGSAFVREVLLRLLLMAGLGLYVGLGWTFDGYLTYYIAANIACGGLMAWLVVRAGRFRFTGRLRDLPRPEVRELVSYGLFSVLSVGSATLIASTDALMLGSMVGEGVVGIYRTYLYVAVVIAMPTRAFIRITRGVIADRWARADFDALRTLYKQTAVMQFLLACWVFCGIWLCRDLLTTLIRNPEFAPYFPVFIGLGLAYVAEAFFGIAPQLMITSEHFRFDFYLNLVFLALNVGLNWFFIQRWGAVGASAATALTAFGLNLTRALVLYRYYGLFPLTLGHLKVLGSALVAFGACRLVPTPPNLWLATLATAGVFSCTYLAGLMLTSASADLTAFMRILWYKLPSRHRNSKP